MIYSNRGFFSSHFEQAFAQGSSTVNCALEENVVKCVGGFVDNGSESPSGMSCSAECADKCCSSTGEPGGANACSMFTGSVCRDGSCIGDRGKLLLLNFV